MWLYCLRTSRVIPIYIFILFTIQSGRVNVIKMYLISFTLYTVSTQITTINFDDLYAVFGEGAFYCLYSSVENRMDYFSTCTSTFYGLNYTSFAFTVIPLHSLPTRPEEFNNPILLQSKALFSQSQKCVH